MALPKTEADDVAATLPEPSGTRADSRSIPDDMGEFNGADEDLELQMALQASLGHDIPPPPSDPPQLIRTSIPLPLVDSFPSSASGSGARTPSQRIDSPLSPNTQDPVAASMAQSRRIYERMLAEQTEAHRELATEAGINPRRRQEEEEEEEMLRQAIAESEALARLEGHGRPDDDDDDEADDMDVDQSQAARPPQNLMSPRVYDDEDEELQAALRASLEHIPEGWTPPAETSVPALLPNTTIPINRSASLDSVEDDESIASEDTTTMESSEAPAEPVDVDEMRKRRLARFGG